jgi:hypothetical protein|tara:strand:- start:146 stop:448 length:303 start_codon:yes stop_codon:yes gene_type:complete
MEYLHKLNNEYFSEVKEFLKEDKVKYLLQGILILYISFWLPDTTYDAVASFDNVVVRMVFTILIVILSLIEEYTSAILLSLAFVLSVQRLNKYKLEKNVN